MSLTLAPSSPKVLAILRDRLESLLEVCRSGGFAHEQMLKLRLAEISVEGVEMVGEDDTAPSRGAQATVVMELEVGDNDCNVSGNAHGGFLAWLIDMASSMPLLALAGHDRWTTTGVSSNINVFYLAACPNGTTIRIISTVLQQGKTSATMQARVEDKETGKLFAVGTHVKQDVLGGKSKGFNARL